MIILYINPQNPFRVPGRYDPDEIRTMTWLFRPPAWVTATVYEKRSSLDFDVVVPSVFTGVYFKCHNSGKSGATEPVWVRTNAQKTADGLFGLVWECVDYDLLPVAETITAATFTATNSVTVTPATPAFTATSCTFTITTVPAAAIAAGIFEVTAHLVKSTGDEFDATMRFVVGNR